MTLINNNNSMPAKHSQQKYTLGITDHDIHIHEKAISVKYESYQISTFSNRSIYGRFSYSISISHDNNVLMNDLPISIMLFTKIGSDEYCPLALHGKLIDNLPIISLLSNNRIVKENTIVLYITINSNPAINKIIIPITNPVLQALSIPCTVNFYGQIELREKPKIVTYNPDAKDSSNIQYTPYNSIF
jgi:hypothetical protein